MTSVSSPLVRVRAITSLPLSVSVCRPLFGLAWPWPATFRQVLALPTRSPSWQPVCRPLSAVAAGRPSVAGPSLPLDSAARRRLRRKSLDRWRVRRPSAPSGEPPTTTAAPAPGRSPRRAARATACRGYFASPAFSTHRSETASGISQPPTGPAATDQFSGWCLRSVIFYSRPCACQPVSLPECARQSPCVGGRPCAVFRTMAHWPLLNLLGKRREF
jgi:hypothetical protein